MMPFSLTLSALIHLTNAASADEPEVIIEKSVVYEKESTVDLTGSNVNGSHQLPSAFFLSRLDTPKAKGLLPERLNFSLRNYNDLGF